MKNFQLLSTTTYKDLEEYFSNNLYDRISVEDRKREFIFTIGEYGALLFNKCLTNFAKDFELDIKFNVLSLQKASAFEKQFVKYNMPNGVTIKLLIQEEEYSENVEREEVSGFPLQSMLLKFKEIV